MKIYGNTITGCGESGIKVEGKVDAEISQNTIIGSKIGVDVDQRFLGTIANNNIQDTKEFGVLVRGHNPYAYFEIPQEIDSRELLELFKKLDTNSHEQHQNIMEESILSKLDKFTAISERVHIFIQEYGPKLVFFFQPFLNN